MLSNQKREPAYSDLDKMPFGKHAGELLQDVPASYLLWLWGKRPINDTKLQNYIWNSKDAIEQETGEEL